MGFLTEDIQVVNAGAPIYTRAAEGSINKTLLQIQETLFQLVLLVQILRIKKKMNQLV